MTPRPRLVLIVMTTNKSVAAADWFQDAGTRRVMDALQAARPDGSRFVGGVVRNTLMGHPASDVDIATQLRPEETISAIEAAGLRAIPTGIDHGTITAICDHKPFEITTLRRDVETDGRRAVVAFTEDWEEDAARRDFRLNALYADANGTVYDPTGGLPDIDARKVVFIGEAEQRLREDHLRSLRFFRFSAWYANSIDETGLSACEALKDGLSAISVERIWKEVLKLFDAPQPYTAVSAMIRTGVMQVILPEADNGARLARLRGIELAERLRFEAFQRFLCLFPRSADVAASVSTRLKVSGKERDRMKDWAKASAPPDDENDLKPWLYKTGTATAQDLIAWHWADRNVPGMRLADTFRLSQTWQAPVFPIKGADLVARGHKPGPELGERLKRLEAEWIANGFSLDGVDQD